MRGEDILDVLKTKENCNGTILVNRQLRNDGIQEK